MAETKTCELRVVGKDGCPQCVEMQIVLEDRCIGFRYEKMADPAERAAELGRVGSKTFPLVFYGDEYVGNTELASWLMKNVEEVDEDEEAPDVGKIVAKWKARSQ